MRLEYKSIFLLNKVVSFDYSFLNSYLSLIKFRIFLPGDLLAVSPFSDYTGSFFGLCIGKYFRGINSTFYLRNVFHYNIVEKIYSIGCSFLLFTILRPFYKMFIRNKRKKLFFYRIMLRSLNNFKLTFKELKIFNSTAVEIQYLLNLLHY